jgi:uncharacterized membrane protein
MKVKGNPRSSRNAWLIAAGLVLLSAIPVASGALRLIELAGGPHRMPANPSMTAMPLPVLVHIIGASVFALLGAFQFVTGYRRRAFGWHRAAGRVVVACGLFVGLSGLWMTLFYPSTGGLLYIVRLVFGSAMVVSIIMGFVVIIRRRDVLEHRAWMIRAYAIGMAAGTQALTGMAESLLFAHPNELSRALAMTAGWVINLIIAEWAIRRLPAQRARTVSAMVSRELRETL